jgi:hypothetical protein
MSVRIQFRRGTAAEWTSANPTLATGELGYEVDTAAIKIGDGVTAWASLAYGAVSEAYVADAIAGVVGLAPDALDTLNELAAAIGDDANFIATIGETISQAEDSAIAHADSILGDHNSDQTGIHGIADTSLLETKSGAQTKANIAQGNAASYTDSAVAALVDSSPGVLDTLNELAAAIGDDADFASTVSANIATKLAYIIGTASDLGAANAVTYANTIYIESDTNYARIGDGITEYNDVTWIGKSYADFVVDTHAGLEDNVHGIADVTDLVISSQLAVVNDALGDHESKTIDVHGIADTSDLLVTVDLTIHSADTTAVHGIADTSLLAVTSDISTAVTEHNADTTAVHGIADTSLLVLTEDLAAYQTTSAASTMQGTIDEKADIDGPTFSGTVELPATTSIGSISAVELGHLNGTISNIQTQMDAKLASASAASTYAPLDSPTFIGTVVLPSSTSIDGVSAVEIGYLSTATSDVQVQIDTKAPTASPTFTGTVSGVTPAMIGLGSVDNTTDLAKPISTATQTALDAKLNLAGGTLTGPLLLAADPTQALGVVTKQYADSISQGLRIHEAAQAATTANVDLSTGLVDSTVIDGVTLATGDRVLVKAQTDASENGIYVTAASGAASRALDFDEPLEMSGGDFVFVLGGTLYDNTGWVKTSGDVVTVGTDELEFTQFSGAGSVTAGTNLEVSGTQISLAADPTLVDATITTLDVTNLVFPDGTTQTSAGVVSLTTFTEKTASYTLDALPHQDAVVEMNSESATTFTIPANSTLAWPVGASMDIMQTGAGQVTVSGASGVTVNFTPGNKLRTQWSSCTIMKRSTDSWILFGDLTA